MSRGRFSAPETPRWAGTLLALLAAVYLLSEWVFPGLFANQPGLPQGLVETALWGSLGGLSLFLWKRSADRPRYSWPATVSGLAVGLFAVSVLVIVGFVAGFAPNASPNSFQSLLLNSIRLAAFVAGIEFSRAYLFQAWRAKGVRTAYVATVLLFFVIATPLGQWRAIHDPISFFEVAFGIWLPALALSFVATWLVDFGGIGPSFAYRLPIMAFIWLAPFAPDLNWQTTMLVGTITPLLSIPLIAGVHNAWAAHAERTAATELPRRRWPSMAVTIFGLLVMLLFFAGTFGIRPFVVSGISMEPAIEHGDLAIVRESIDPQTVQVGDILKFRQGELGVVHRVVAIDQGPLFITQGDNANHLDQPVAADQIEGKVVFVIPKIGYLGLWLHRA